MQQEAGFWELGDVEAVAMDGSVCDVMHCWRTRPIVRHAQFNLCRKLGPDFNKSPCNIHPDELDGYVTEGRITLLDTPMPVMHDAMVLCVRQRVFTELQNARGGMRGSHQETFNWQTLPKHEAVWVGIANDATVVAQMQAWANALYAYGLKIARKFYQAKNAAVGQHAEVLFTMARQMADNSELRLQASVGTSAIYQLQEQADFVDHDYNFRVKTEFGITRPEFDKKIDELLTQLRSQA